MSNKKKFILIIGAFGQDGTILTNLLKNNGYSNIILVGRKQSNISRVIDITVQEDLEYLFETYQIGEVYFLAATQPNTAKDQQLSSYLEVNLRAVNRILELIVKKSPTTKFFHANSAYTFGNGSRDRITEDTPKQPTCPYGVSKLLANQIIQYYREEHQTFIVDAFLFNHESHFRKDDYLIKKVLRCALSNSNGIKSCITINDIDKEVDWGYAPLFIEAFLLLMNKELSGDYIISSGEGRKVRELCDIIFSYFNLNYPEFIDERTDLKKEKSKRYLIGDNTKLQKATKWEHNIIFKDWVQNICSEYERLHKNED